MLESLRNNSRAILSIAAKAFILLLLASSSTVTVHAKTPDCSGWWDGQTQPYEISNIDDLQCMKEDVSADYVLVEDIDASETDSWNNGRGFEPVVDFSGDFDGRGYSISGLSFEGYYQNNVGIFATLENNNRVENLKIVNANVSTKGPWYVGTVAGYILSGSTLTNITVLDSSIIADGQYEQYYYGGLTGYSNGLIRNSYADVTVGGTEWYSGGIVGYSNDGVVANCSSSGYMYSNSRAGGIAAQSMNVLKNSFSNATISGNGINIGGLVGRIKGEVNNSYSTGYIDASGGNTGGLIGDIWEGDGTVHNSFWDVNTSGQTNSDGGTGKTTEEMTNISTFTNLNTTGLNEPWDFYNNPNDDNRSKDVWDKNIEINKGYPVLNTDVGRKTSFDSEMKCYITEDCHAGTPLAKLENHTEGSINAHTQLVNYSGKEYKYSICCETASQELSNSCSANQSKEFLKLSNKTNSHVQAVDASITSKEYEYPVCAAGDEGKTLCKISTTGRPNDLYECLGSMASSESNGGDYNLTNAHIAECNHYQTNVYCRLNNPPNPARAVLTTTNGNNTSSENVTAEIFESYDLDDDNLSVIFDWRKNNQSISKLNMPFDVNRTENISHRVLDYSTFNNNGELGNKNKSKVPTWKKKGVSGGAYKFDGVDDGIQIPSDSSHELTDSFTLSAWAYPTDNKTDGAKIICKNNCGGSSATDYALQIYPNAVNFRVGDGGSTYNVDGDSVPLNEWTHIVGVWDGEYLKIYQNGKFINSQPYSGSVAARSNPLLIGNSGAGFGNGFGGLSDDSSRNFPGLIDEVKIYDKALTSEQIKQSFNEDNKTLNDKKQLETKLVSNETVGGQTLQVASTVTDGIQQSKTLLSEDLRIKGITTTLLEPEDTFYSLSQTFNFSCRSTSDLGVKEVSLMVWNKSGSLVLEDNKSVSGNTVNVSWSKTVPYEGSFPWTCVGKNTDNKTATPAEGNRTITYDTGAPDVQYQNPTPKNDTIVGSDTLLVNASINNSAMDNMTHNFNGSLHTPYDEDLRFMMSFENNTDLGENSSYFKDVSKYDNDAVCKDGECPSYASGRYGSGIKLDDNLLRVEHSDSLDITDELTISYWINVDSHSSSSSIVTKGSWDRAYSTYFFSDGDFAFLTKPPGETWNSMTSNSQLDTNRWYYITLVKTASERKIYVDGELDKSESYSKSIESVEDSLTFGEEGDSHASTLDEFRIWNRSLTADEIKREYRSNLKKYDEEDWRFKSNYTNLSDGKYNVSLQTNTRTGLSAEDKRTFSISSKQPLLIDPSGNISNRKPVFNWSSVNDADRYELNVTAPSSVDCFGFYEDNVTSSSFNSTQELCTDLDYDSSAESFTWKVRSCSGGSCSPWSNDSFDVNSVNSISLVNSSVSFGNLLPGDVVNTTNGSASPLVVRNQGNIRVDLDVSANESLFDNVGLNTSNFQLQSGVNDVNAFNESGSVSSWLNVTNSSQNLIKQLKYFETEQDASVDIRVEVPDQEPTGSKTSTITVESIPND